MSLCFDCHILFDYVLNVIRPLNDPSLNSDKLYPRTFQLGKHNSDCHVSPATVTIVSHFCTCLVHRG